MENEITILSIIRENFSAITAILGGVVSGTFTWVVSKHQFSIKKYEIETRVEFDARKLIYDSFKYKLKKYFQIIKDNSNSMGKLYWTFALEGFDKLEREIKLFCDASQICLKTENRY